MRRDLSIASTLENRLGGRWSVRTASASSFCDSWIAQCQARVLFLKSVPPEHEAVLTAEADGLNSLRETHTIRVPAVIDCWSDDESCVLAMEWLEFSIPDAGFGSRFAEALAQLHAAPTEREVFGWHRDNMLGGTQQLNRWSQRSGRAGWTEFLGTQRFGAMRQRLRSSNADESILEITDEVIERLPDFFRDGHEPRPSLIHGDLWSGNWSMLHDGSPVVFDPAVSCSDAEADLAMMELFGDVPVDFWPAYRSTMAISEGYAWRRHLYQLYHLLNHVLLFGSSYTQRALATGRAALNSIRK
ncbi:MAG: fructosamine kinase family protein [Povalibacter sp.]